LELELKSKKYRKKEILTPIPVSPWRGVRLGLNLVLKNAKNRIEKIKRHKKIKFLYNILDELWDTHTDLSLTSKEIIEFSENVLKHAENFRSTRLFPVSAKRRIIIPKKRSLIIKKELFRKKKENTQKETELEKLNKNKIIWFRPSSVNLYNKLKYKKKRRLSKIKSKNLEKIKKKNDKKLKRKKKRFMIMWKKEKTSYPLKREYTREIHSKKVYLNRRTYKKFFKKYMVFKYKEYKKLELEKKIRKLKKKKKPLKRHSTKIFKTYYIDKDSYKKYLLTKKNLENYKNQSNFYNFLKEKDFINPRYIKRKNIFTHKFIFDKKFPKDEYELRKNFRKPEKISKAELIKKHFQNVMAEKDAYHKRMKDETGIILPKWIYYPLGKQKKYRSLRYIKQFSKNFRIDNSLNKNKRNTSIFKKLFYSKLILLPKINFKNISNLKKQKIMKIKKKNKLKLHKYIHTIQKNSKFSSFYFYKTTFKKKGYLKVKSENKLNKNKYKCLLN
jgi:hypothetical protein